MKKVIVVGVIALFIVVGIQPAFANDNNISIGKVEQQPRGETFYKTYGEGGGRHVQQTTDGGYIIVGDNGYVIWLIKTDSAGNMLWDKTYWWEDYAYGYCVQQTSDGGYILVGHSYSDFMGEGFVWLMKTDSTGKKEWGRTFGEWQADEAYYVQQTIDGGYILTGFMYGELFLLKTDSDGIKEWCKYPGGICGYCVQQTTDGGYIITGYTWYSDALLIKTDNAGNKQWERTFYDTLLSGNECYCVQQTSDGGYIITGYTTGVFEIFKDVWLIKTDSDGNMLWKKTFGERWCSEAGYSVQQTTDDGYIITGYGGRYGILLIKTDGSGNKEWDNYFKEYKGYCVQQTSDGGYIITGGTGGFNSKVLLIKTNEYGKSKTKAVTSNMLLLRILERFPLLQKLLLFIK